MSCGPPPTYLAEKNSHPRDANISFDEGPHIYTINGDSNYMSVTTWNHSHFEKFNADKIIDRMMKSKNWPNSKYYGQTREEIKAGWDANRDAGAAAGTKMHYDIECYYNKWAEETEGIDLTFDSYQWWFGWDGNGLRGFVNMLFEKEMKSDAIEYEYFRQFVKSAWHLIPYRTEWMIYHEELRFAGSIDFVCKSAEHNNSLIIYDWKRCKSIEKASSWNKFATREEISYIPDTNYWHYCLQLNTYAVILEEKYDKVVSEMYLVCLHPDNKNKSYQDFRVPNLRNEVYRLFAVREKMLKENA